MTDFITELQQYPQTFLDWVVSPAFITQAGIVAVAFALATFLATAANSQLKPATIVKTPEGFGDLKALLNK